jgi:transposase
MNTWNRRSPRDWREARRLRAWALHQQGWTGIAIAVAFGVTKGAVSHWLKRAREGGVEGLYSQPPPGPTPRLTGEQLAQLPSLLARGAEAFGFLGEVWTAKRVAAVIREEFGVRYHPAGSRKAVAAYGGLEPPEAHPSGDSTRRSGH